jgi:predicted dithiol-disulfide oxidoreductase (DUF899 family)
MAAARDPTMSRVEASVVSTGHEPRCGSMSLIDGFDRASISVTHHAAFTVVAKAPAKRLNAWANSRGWSQIHLVSAEKTEYLRD